MLSIYKMTFFANFLKHFCKPFSKFQGGLNVRENSTKAADKFSRQGHTKYNERELVTGKR